MDLQLPSTVNLSRQGILWDLDGVLVDTGEYHFQSWKIVLEDLGITLDQAIFQKTLGMNSRSSLEIYLGRQPAADVAINMITRKEEAFRQLIQNDIVPLPGVIEWLEWFDAQHMPMAVASSAPPDNIDFILHALKIKPYFSELVSGADMPGKPNPAVFLEAAQRLALMPEDCIVIEDSIAGVEAACRAGMRCIAVATTNPASMLSMATLVVENLAALSRIAFLQIASGINQ